jgi:hypothetical protein
MKNLMFLTMMFGLMMILTETGNAQIKIGDVVNLQGSSGKTTYLETRGRVMDKPQFKGVSENVFVSTHTSPDRDKGSGSWKIVSAANKKDGETLVYGDKIHLLNMYSGAGYLDVWSQKIPAFDWVDPNHADVMTFTSTSKNRENGSGTWTVSGGANNTQVKENDTIRLESSRMPKHYLHTAGNVTDKRGPFQEYAGNVFMVWVSDHAVGGTDKWKITLRK